MTKQRARVLIVLILVQIVLVALGASHVYMNEQGLGPVGKALDYWGLVSGSDFGYGFFAPGVSADVRAEFDVAEADGHVVTESILPGSNHEADIRIGDIVEKFTSDDFFDGDEQDQQLYRSLAASLCGAVFGRHPGATAVTIRLEQFKPISMDDYRAGNRPAWDPIYSAKFVRREATAMTTTGVNP